MTSRKQDGRETEELLREGCRRLTLEKQNGGKVNVKEMATRRPQATENTHPVASIVSPKSRHNMHNPLKTDMGNFPNASAFAFHYNLNPMHYGQANDSALFHFPAGTVK